MLGRVMRIRRRWVVGSWAAMIVAMLAILPTNQPRPWMGVLFVWLLVNVWITADS